MNDQANSIAGSRERSQSENILVELIRSAVIPTALLSSLGYFLGWSASAAYYTRIGIPTSFLPKTVPGILVFAWVDIVLIALTFVLGVGMMSVLNRFAKIADPRQLRKKTFLFFFLLFLAIAIGAIALYILRWFGITLPVLGLAGASIVFLWITTILGKQIQDHSHQEDQANQYRFFHLVFPNYYLYVFLTILFTIFFLNRFGIWRGVYLAERDMQGQFSRANLVLYAEKPLPIEGAYDPVTQLYTYKDLRLFEVNEQYIYVLKKIAPTDPNLSGQSTFATYFIQRDLVQIFEVIK